MFKILFFSLKQALSILGKEMNINYVQFRLLWELKHGLGDICFTVTNPNTVVAAYMLYLGFWNENCSDPSLDSRLCTYKSFRMLHIVKQLAELQFLGWFLQ